jgi:hypothetical protein
MRNQFFSVSIGIVALVAVFAAAGTASADWCFPGWYGCNTYSQESVPYYALNPPVYYSRPVMRTYGLFPFPYYVEPSNPPVAVAVEPRLVANRFVDRNPVAVASDERMPLRIANPFVEQTASDTTVQPASYEEPSTAKPKVVYPARLAAAQ